MPSELTNKPPKTTAPLTLDEYVLQVYLEKLADRIFLKRNMGVVVPRKQYTTQGRVN
jgi:hypothetical protein